MSTRVTLLSLLVILIVLGLIAGFFAGSIQKALFVPASQTMTHLAQNNPPQAAAPAAPAAPPAAQGGNANTLAQDSFQRKDQPLWGNASDGRTWQGDANTANAFSVTNGTGQIANVAGTFNALLGQPTTNVDITMNGSINHFNNGKVNLGTVVRWTDDRNWYKTLIDGTNIILLKRVNGVTKTLATAPFQAQDGMMYSLRFRVLGAMLFARVWPVGTPEPANWMLNVTDNTLTTGQVGVRVVLQKTTVVAVTNFLVVPATMGNTV